jgi:hypothetical protein
MIADKSELYEDKETDPRIEFYEFVLICGRMALHSMKEMNTVKDRINNFFLSKLHFSKVIFGKKFDFNDLYS